MKRDRIKDSLRTLFRIRVRRRLDSADRLPEVGARIILDGMRMRVDAPLSEDAWQWLMLQGWRECRFRSDRRGYIDLPPGAYKQLRIASPRHRERTHRRIVEFVRKARQYSPRPA